MRKQVNSFKCCLISLMVSLLKSFANLWCNSKRPISKLFLSWLHVGYRYCVIVAHVIWSYIKTRVRFRVRPGLSFPPLPSHPSPQVAVLSNIGRRFLCCSSVCLCVCGKIFGVCFVIICSSPSFFLCLGRAGLCDCCISCVSSLIFLSICVLISSYFMTLEGCVSDYGLSWIAEFIL